MAENKIKAMYPITLPKTKAGADNVRNAESINEEHLNENFKTLLNAILNVSGELDAALRSIGINVVREQFGHGVEADVISLEYRDEYGHIRKVTLSGGGLHFFDNGEEFAQIGTDREGYSYGYIELTDKADGADTSAEFTGSGMSVQDYNNSTHAHYGTTMSLGDEELDEAQLGTLVNIRKSLWTGTAVAGDTITVEGIMNYHVVEISFQGKHTKVLATVGGVAGDGAVQGVGGLVTGTTHDTVFFFNASITAADTLEIVKTRSVTGSTREALTVTEIVGLI